MVLFFKPTCEIRKADIIKENKCAEVRQLEGPGQGGDPGPGSSPAAVSSGTSHLGRLVT